jgi:Fic family protein
MISDQFKPLYTITPKLLDLIKQISVQISALNARRFPKVILAEYERHAREISSYSSTSIEGNPLPLTEVKRILKNHPSHVSDSQKEVLNYNKALLWLNSQITENKGVKFDEKLILRIHQNVMEGLIIKVKCGSFRKEPVFVNDPTQRKTVYWAPDHQDVQGLINELLYFIKNNLKDMDSVILSGILHKQFIIIHPFIDGNGRTVRLLTKALLAGMGLNTFNLFSFENYYNRNVSRYFDNVGVRGNYYDIASSVEFTPWLEYFAEGILDELFRVSKELEKEVVDPSDELKEHHKSIIDFIEKNGYISDREYSKMTDRAKPTRALDFNKLIDLGLIERKGKGKATFYKLKK